MPKKSSQPYLLMSPFAAALKQPVILKADFKKYKGCLEEAQRLETNQQVQLGKQTSATSTLNELTQVIRLKFVGDRRITRYVLKRDPVLAEELRLHLNTKKSREALIRQMTHFYEEVVKYPELMVKLSAGYNLTAELFASRQRRNRHADSGNPGSAVPGGPGPRGYTRAARGHERARHLDVDLHRRGPGNISGRGSESAEAEDPRAAEVEEGGFRG